MLLSLKIQNLILIEQAEIHFGPGLNILTGETGSGKSAILTAIRLISGERAETQMIRKESLLAIVEASLSTLDLDLLEEEGIALPLPGMPITIRREIHRSGKNRCFINDSLVNVSLLRKCVSHAIERVDQSSSQELCSLEEQRKMLDATADLGAVITQFSQSFTEEKKFEAELLRLTQSQELRERDLKWAEEDLSAIEEADLKEGEEKTLSQQHNLLTHAQELLEKIGTLSSTFSEGPHPLVTLLKRCQATLESCVRFDPKISPIADSVKSAALELEEAGRWLHSYANRLEADPQRLDAIEKRIGTIEATKRRFGGSFEEVQKRRLQLKDKIDTLLSLDTQIETVQASLKELQQKNLSSSLEISKKRKAAALFFNSQVLRELKTLNLPHAQFSVSIDPKPLSANGADEIHFLFSANPGVPPIPLEQCASGGELSRLLLAVKTILSEKTSCACLVFDEIDSNVGGQTATILGEKLNTLSQKRQVVCVTHFVQVAKCAMHHFLVSKSERKGLAFTSIAKLSPAERNQEYSRMLGCL